MQKKMKSMDFFLTYISHELFNTCLGEATKVMAGQESTHDVLCAVTHDLCLHSNSNQGILSPNLPCRINQCSDSDYLAKATFFSPKHICI